MRVLYIPYTYSPDSSPGREFFKLQKRFEGRIFFETLKFPSAAYALQGDPQYFPSLEEMFTLIKSMDWDYDYIIGQGYGGMLWVILSRYAEVKIPAVVIPYINPINKRLVLLLLLLASLKCPQDRILVGSRVSARLFQTLGIKAIAHEAFGINSDSFHHLDISREQLLSELGMPDGIYLIYAGRIEADKSITTLLSIYLRVSILYSNCRLLIASHHIDEDYLEVISEIIHRYDTINLILQPSHQDLNKYYNLATLFISASTSYYETFGRAPVEAMACGTPPVVPKYNGFRDTITKKTGILVPTRWTNKRIVVDDQEFVRQIYELLNAPQKLNRMSIAALHRAQQFYIDRTIAIFDRLLQPGRQKSQKYSFSKNILSDSLPAFVRLVMRDFDQYSPKKCLELLFDQSFAIQFAQDEWELYYENAFRHF